MTYIVLARRYRPQRFDEIVGQEHVTTTLANAIEMNRIAHSYIFAGPRGVGKTTTARILAKALNCEKGPIPIPCNNCAACQAITKTNSLDVLEIDGASNRGIDEIRNLRENIRFTPTQGKYRIYIIDEVHMLTKEAFNALLKTLEEPPSHAIFIFATTEIHRVPATILSRCQRFDFKRIPVKTIINHLGAMCKAENIDVEEDALLHIAKKAEGSMRDAQSILDQMISYSGEKITVDQVSRALGLIDLELFFNFTTNINNGHLKDLIMFCQQINNQGYDLGEFLSGFEEHIRNLLITKTLGNTELLNVPEHFQENYMQESEKFQVNDLLVYLQQMTELQNSIKWSVHPQMKFELGILKMAKLPKALDIENLLQKLELLKKKAGKVDELNISNTEISDKPNLSSIQQFWPQLVEDFKQSKVNLATAIELGKPTKLENLELTVNYDSVDAFHVSWLNKNKRIVEEALFDRFNNHFKITTHTIKSSKQNVKETTGQDSKKAINKMMEEDPLINKLIKELGLELT